MSVPETSTRTLRQCAKIKSGCLSGAMAEIGLTMGFDETNPISLRMIPIARLSRPSGRWRRPVGPRSSIPATYTVTAPSILWFATIQCVEGKQDLADLAPQDRFIPAEPIEREAGQIGQAQEAAGEVGGGIDGFRLGAGHSFRSSCNGGRGSIGVGIDRASPGEHRVDCFASPGEFGECA
jgi:hypothetical protein